MAAPTAPTAPARLDGHRQDPDPDPYLVCLDGRRWRRGEGGWGREGGPVRGAEAAPSPGLPDPRLQAGRRRRPGRRRRRFQRRRPPRWCYSHPRPLRPAGPPRPPPAPRHLLLAPCPAQSGWPWCTRAPQPPRAVGGPSRCMRPDGQKDPDPDPEVDLDPSRVICSFGQAPALRSVNPAFQQHPCNRPDLDLDLDHGPLAPRLAEHQL